MVISIHVNAANLNWKDPAGARGFETYFLAEAKTEDERRVAKMENEVVRFESSGGPAAEEGLGFILKDMAQNEQLRESSDLAETPLPSQHSPSRAIECSRISRCRFSDGFSLRTCTAIYSLSNARCDQ